MENALKKNIPGWFLTHSPSTDPKSDGITSLNTQRSIQVTVKTLFGKKNQKDWYKQERQNRNLKQRFWVITECMHAHCSIAHSWLTLCDPKDYSPPWSFVHGIFQARILEWVAFSYSRGSSQTRDWIQVSWVSCTVTWILYHWATLETQMHVCVYLYLYRHIHIYE